MAPASAAAFIAPADAPVTIAHSSLLVEILDRACLLSGERGAALQHQPELLFRGLVPVHRSGPSFASFVICVLMVTPLSDELASPACSLFVTACYRLLLRWPRRALG